MHFKTTALFKAVCNLKKQAARQKNLLLAMKLTAIILLTACIGVSARTTAQTVSFSGKDVTLQIVFDAVTKQTGYTVFCNYDLLRNAKKVTLNLRNATLDQVMQEALKNQPLTYTIIEKTIVVKAKSPTVDLQSTDNPPIVSQPPPIDIRGRITNENGEPVVASVMVKGTQQGTTTNADGYFELKGVVDDATLVITGVNIESREVRVGGKSELAITAVTKVTSMNEVVINKGYYTEKQRLSTGNVGRISAKDIEKQPVTNPLLAMQGRIPGLVITQNTGVPGGGVKVRIQGRNNLSLTSGTDPLYVIDGMPYVSQMLSTFTGGPTGSILGKSDGPVGSGGGNPLNYINPDDIESIEVLKDADATAIYGSRAANGAILITTKKGKVGQTKININYQTGWGQVTRKLDLLNTQQYLEMRREAFKNDGATPTLGNAPDLLLWDTTRYTDWQEKLIGKTARFTQVTGGVSGGSQTMQYLISGTYNKQTTVFPTDFNDQRGSVHFNINGSSINQKFNIQLLGNYLVDNNRLPALDFTHRALGLAPNAPALYNEDGSLNWAPNVTGTSTWTNPLGATLKTYENKTTNLVSSAIISYKITPGLEVKTNFGYTNLQANEYQAYPAIANEPEYRPYIIRTAWHSNSNINSWIIEPLLNYKKSFNFGKLDFLAGTTIQQRNSNGQSLEGSGYNSDQVMKDILSAPNINVNGTENAVYKYNALFARLNYNWKDRYIINLTSRRDGSSRFGKNNQFHNFWGVGAAWLFSEESFLKNSNSIISFGKLKGSYGTTGSDQIGDFRFLNLYAPVVPGVGYQGLNGLQPTGLPNPYIEWEETKKLQGGIEIGLFNDRIFLSTVYAENKTSNHLLDYVLPTTTGYAGILENLPATIRNTSWEVALNTVNLRSKVFSWSSFFNITIPKNKLVDFPNYGSSSYSSGNFGVIPGQPLGVVKAYNFMGVNPTTGVYQFRDINGNATAQPKSVDRGASINLQPEYYGGLQNSVQFHGFQLDFLFQFSKQIGAQYLFRNVPGRYLSGDNNQPVSVLTRWQKPGDITDIQKFSQGFGLLSPYFNVTQSDYIYGDASYVRLKNLSISYQLPSKLVHKIRFQNFRFYVQAQNLITITSYKGMDPENATTTSIPPLRLITTGVQVGL